MITLLLLASIHAQFLAAPQVQLYDAHAGPVAPGNEPGAPETPPLALYAAGGESEFFRLLIQNDSTVKTLETCSLVWDDDLEILSRTYGLKGRRDTVIGTFSDASEILLPFTSTSLDAGETRHLVVNLYVPPDTSPGLYTGQVSLQFGDGGAIKRPITLEIFDFSLPVRSSIPVLFGIDYNALQQTFGLGASLEDWAAIYDLLTASRTGFQVWPQQQATGDIFYDDRDVPLIKGHLDYAVRAEMLPIVGIGDPAGTLLEQWPAPAFNTPQDPLQLLLFSLSGSLESSGWHNSAVLVPTTLPPRPDWQQVRLACARVERADTRIRTLIAAPAHPFFERYADIWALPVSTPTAALELIRRGLSLRRFEQPNPISRQGTTGREDPAGRYQTEVGDAFDGSETTAWYPDPNNVSDESPPWLMTEFAALQTVEQLAILWPPNITPVLPVVETAYNTGSFSQATIRWEENPSWTEGGQAITLGTFRYPRECIALRVQFPAGRDPAFGIAELLINQNGRTPVNAKSEPAEPWLDLRSGNSQSLETIPLRLLPWLCWQRRFDGILGPILGPPDGTGGLAIAAGTDGSGPSIGLFQLRDGLEDFEYLNLYWKAVKKGEIRAPTDFSPGFYPVDIHGAGAESRATLVKFQEERHRMGRLLSGHSEVTKNFGPRKP